MLALGCTLYMDIELPGNDEDDDDYEDEDASDDHDDQITTTTTTTTMMMMMMMMVNCTYVVFSLTNTTSFVSNAPGARDQHVTHN